MKSLSTAALLLLGAMASAQTADWYATRFGFNAPAPDLYAIQSPSDYKNFAYREANPNSRWNTTPASMKGMGTVQAATGKTWNDPTNYLWTDLYEMTDLLPKNSWVRVAGNLLNHFPEPFNPKGHANAARNYGAIINRIMFRGNDLSNGLNILWNVTPSVYPSQSTTDSWSTITTNPWGTKLASNITTGDPAKRDWWRPQDPYLPYLKVHVQNFVYDVNDYASNIVRQRTPEGPLTENFIARMSFQMGNEPAAGHPGGSVDGVVGSWTGVGKVLEKTMSGIDYKAYPSYYAMNNIPAGFGTNQLVMPAFSMFSENPDSYRINYIKGQLRNIQWGGNVAPGLNELATYYKEMQGMNWPTLCGRRALHFNSPTLRWRFNPPTGYASTAAGDLLTSKPFDPSQGRWETPAEYAKRWVAEMSRQVDLVANLPMPGSSKIVDITETYFGGSHSGAIMLDPSFKLENGNTPNYQSMTFDQIREMARSYSNDGGVLKPLQQLPPSRESILAAIRTELYAQDIAGTTTPNLGRIYWWGGYYPDPRLETGLTADSNNNVIGYNPWGDFRLTLSEIKALWNK